MSVDSDRMLDLKAPMSAEDGEPSSSGRSSRRRRRGKQKASSLAVTELAPAGSAVTESVATELTVAGPETNLQVQKPVAALPNKKQTEIYHLTVTSSRDVEGVPVGRGNVAWIAGPGFVESVVQMRSIAESLKRWNCRFLRARAWWPGAKPSDFERHLVSCLSVLREVSREYGLLAVSQIVHRSHLPHLLAYTDVIEVGPENSDDLELLRAIGRENSTVLLFRKPEMSFERFLLSIRALEEGRACKIILGECGMLGAEPTSENVLDLSSIITMRRETKYPVLVDISAVARNASYAENLGLAAVAAGADGIVAELRVEGLPQYGGRPSCSLAPSQLSGMIKRADAFKHTMNALIHTPRHHSSLLGHS